jgi:hypothetical protein
MSAGHQFVKVCPSAFSVLTNNRYASKVLSNFILHLERAPCNGRFFYLANFILQIVDQIVSLLCFTVKPNLNEKATGGGGHRR